MTDSPDIAAVDPDLELTLRPTSLRCAGTLSGRTLPYLLEAAATLLEAQPPLLTVDMSRVYVADVDGANTFVRLQRMARGAGVELRWVGLEPDRVRGLHPLRSAGQHPQAEPLHTRPGPGSSPRLGVRLPPSA